MVRKLIFAISILVFSATSAGCNVSFQSAQYSFIKNLLQPRAPVVEKNWRVVWREKVYFVHAVNHEDGVYFVNDDGLLVFYDGVHVASLSLPSTRNAVAKVTREVAEDGGAFLRFGGGSGERGEIHLCRPWEETETVSGARKRTQRCNSGALNYFNEVRLNEQNEVVGLKQVVVPGLSPIIVERRL